MILKRSLKFAGLFLGPVVLIAFGCSRPQPTLAPAKPAEVIVDVPLSTTVTEYEEFTGRTEAATAVEVRARVTGYLKAIHFKDGSNIQKDAVLFEIDPVLYQAERDRADATYDLNVALLAVAKAELAKAEKDYERLSKTTSVTREEVDRATGDRDKAIASVAGANASIKVAEAQKVVAKQNFDWTTIKAPISGRGSRRSLDIGNLVKADDTVLTSIVTLDPIAVNFDIDDRTMLRVRRLIRDKKVTSALEAITKVDIGLPDEEGYSYVGTIDFIENRLDAGTGTIRVRAAVANAAENNYRLLSPNQFVRVRVPIGNPHPALLIPEESIGTDQGQKFVYTVSKQKESDELGEVEYKKVTLGLQYGQYREVLTGLDRNSKVIISGLQRVRPKAKVTTKAPEKKDSPLKLQTPPSSSGGS